MYSMPVYYMTQVVVQLANTSNFICEHQNYCHPDCYERQRRSCARLIAAVVKVYESKASDVPPQNVEPRYETRDLLRDKLKRRVSTRITQSTFINIQFYILNVECLFQVINY